MEREPASFEQFWPYYVGEHSDPRCRWLHFTGTTLALAAAVVVGVSISRRWLWLAAVAGYGFAWIGHFAFEKNRPATFRHPLWSLRGDFRMYRYMWMGRMTR